DTSEPRGASLFLADEDRPAEELALEAQVVVARPLVPVADLRRIGIAWVAREPLLERAPVQRFVAVPVVFARGDHRREREPGGLDARDRLAQGHEPAVRRSTG